jgi:hypothetical protein
VQKLKGQKVKKQDISISFLEWEKIQGQKAIVFKKRRFPHLGIKETNN